MKFRRKSISDAIISDTDSPVRSITIYETIKHKIITDEFTHATPIIEKLAFEFQCSRTPIREALRKLEQDELVEIIPRKGVYVRHVTIIDIEEVFVVREALEGICAIMAVEVISDHNIKIIPDLLETSYLEFNDGNVEASFQLGNDIHDFILKIAGNNCITKTVASIKDQIQRLHNLAKLIPERLQQSDIEHSEIVKAMELRNGELVERKMREHIRST